MTDTVNTETTAEADVTAAAATAAARVRPQLELGALLEDAISRAVSAQINTAAKDVAAGVIADLLTPEVLAGMRETAILAAEAALDPAAEPEEDQDQDGDEGEEEQEPPQPRYATVEAFVEEYVAPLYRREVSAKGTERSLRWCPRWWDHGEVYARMEALHGAFEFLRLGATVEQSNWFLMHLDPMMDRILDPEGPFKLCSVIKGHSTGLVALPTAPAPQRREDGTYEDTHSGLYIPPAAPNRRRVVLSTPDPDFP